jgi:hypothetical protein
MNSNNKTEVIMDLEKYFIQGSEFAISSNERLMTLDMAVFRNHRAIQDDIISVCKNDSICKKMI